MYEASTRDSRKRKFLEQSWRRHGENNTNSNSSSASLDLKAKRARQKRENWAQAGKTFRARASSQLAWLKQKIIPANYTWTWNCFCVDQSKRVRQTSINLPLCASVFMWLGLCARFQGHTSKQGVFWMCKKSIKIPEWKWKLLEISRKILEPREKYLKLIHQSAILVMSHKGNWKSFRKDFLHTHEFQVVMNN